MKRNAKLWLPLALVLTQAAAADGVLEINQLCVASGCFAGDNPGWPVEITAPGSYRLTSNLVVSSISGPASGISIRKANVSIDLGGFAVLGPVRCDQGDHFCFSANERYGIAGIGLLPNGEKRMGVSVFNGQVRGFDEDCIAIFGTNIRISDVQVSDCGGQGVFIGLGIAERVTASNVGGYGISANTYTTVRDSHLAYNGYKGIVGGICEGNTLVQNGDLDGGLEHGCIALVENNICNGVPCQ